MLKRFKKLLQDIGSAFRTPTLKQKEAYGRLSHTLCAASLVGAVSIMFTGVSMSWYALFRVGALTFWGVLLFLVGAILSKGE